MAPPPTILSILKPILGLGGAATMGVGASGIIVIGGPKAAPCSRILVNEKIRDC